MSLKRANRILVNRHVADPNMTEDDLLKAVRKGAVSLPTPDVQDMFTSGKATRDWAIKNGLKLTVHKGSVMVSL